MHHSNSSQRQSRMLVLVQSSSVYWHYTNQIQRNNADTTNSNRYGRRYISSIVSVVILNGQQETTEILNPDGCISKQLPFIATSGNL